MHERTYERTKDRFEPRKSRVASSLFQSGKRRLSPSAGFSLVELLVAVAVFAALAAAAYGGLAQIGRARSALAAQQDRFAAVARTVSALERDLRQTVSRPVLDAGGAPLPALAGGPDAIELTRLGFANPRAEPRSNLERVGYALDAGKLQRARYAVLDRAPNTAPATSTLADRVDEVHLRYFGCDGAWRDAWPPAEVQSCNQIPQPAPGQSVDRMIALPRAVEFRFVFADIGEIRRVVELVSSLPTVASISNTDAPPPPSNTRPPTDGNPTGPTPNARPPTGTTP